MYCRHGNVNKRPVATAALLIRRAFRWRKGAIFDRYCTFLLLIFILLQYVRGNIDVLFYVKWCQIEITGYVDSTRWESIGFLLFTFLGIVE